MIATKFQFVSVESVIAAMGDVDAFIEKYTATGGYYAPEVVIADNYIRIDWPNSTVQFDSTVDQATVHVIGMRGSIRDCVVPLLRKLGVDLDEGWDIETTRPDVAWYERTPEAYKYNPQTNRMVMVKDYVNLA